MVKYLVVQEGIDQIKVRIPEVLAAKYNEGKVTMGEVLLEEPVLLFADSETAPYIDAVSLAVTADGTIADTANGTTDGGKDNGGIYGTNYGRTTDGATPDVLVYADIDSDLATLYSLSSEDSLVEGTVSYVYITELNTVYATKYAEDYAAAYLSAYDVAFNA